mmetsp:Transcript_27277/g.31774  ORF Transcript_27277/g.31774 Transcript_27277/m.31774 type:complete len:633 (+) Transcript_27277:132-2030(+)
MGQRKSRGITASDSRDMPEYDYLAHEDDGEDEHKSENHHSALHITSNNSNNDESSDGSTGSTSPLTEVTKTLAEAVGIDGNGNSTRNWQRSYTLTLYTITTILLFADQNLLAPNLSAAAEEFGFDNDQRDKKLGGDIALAFFLLGAPASFLVGCGADTDSISRSFLFGLIVIIGEGACFCTFFTTTYAGLYVTRALTGFSVGGALPLLSSVLGDWFPPEERSAVMASVGIGTGIGIAFGQGIAGFMGPIYGWRSPFLVVSIPALIVGALVMTTVKDPVRGGSERIHINNDDKDHIDERQEKSSQHLEAMQIGGTSSNPPIRLRKQNSGIIMNNDSGQSIHIQNSMSLELTSSVQTGEERPKRRCEKMFALLKPSTYKPHIDTMKELFQSKTVILTLIQGAPGCVPWGIVNTFLNDYLSEDCGLSVQSATGIILFFGLGNFFGMVIGGVCGDYLYKKDSRYPSLLSGSMAIIGCFPLWVLVNTTHVDDDEDFTGWMVICAGFISILAGVGSGVTGPIVKATLQNVTLPHARGQAFALLNTFDDFGRGLGPVFVAFLIIRLGGRQAAFNVGIAGWVLCGLFNLCIFFTVRSDELATRRRFQERYSSLEGTNHTTSLERTNDTSCILADEFDDSL